MPTERTPTPVERARTAKMGPWCPTHRDWMLRDGGACDAGTHTDAEIAAALTAQEDAQKKLNAAK